MCDYDQQGCGNPSADCIIDPDSDFWDECETALDCCGSENQFQCDCIDGDCVNVCRQTDPDTIEYNFTLGHDPCPNLVCCDVGFEPIASHKAGLLYPEVIVIGLSNFALTGSNTP